MTMAITILRAPQALITCLGLGIKGEPFEASQLRYHRIVLMTDADVDGAHIRTLLLTFLYRYQRSVIDDGYVYIAYPPLYKVRRHAHPSQSHTVLVFSAPARSRLDLGSISARSRQVRQRSKTRYAYSDEQLRSLLAELSGKPTVQRFKGLGEMMPAELWSTTMDPSTRMLKRVTVEDAAQADRVFSILMGSNIAPRKAFITEQAESLDWDMLDI